MNRLMKELTVFASLFAVGLFFVPYVLGQLDPEVALRAAIETETVEGDLEGAIEQYQEIAASGDRSIAVKALVRMGGCYEKLGIGQARSIYEQVVRDYADQPESVAAAQARLEQLRSSAADEERLALRRIWLDEGGPWINGTVSSNGRFLSFTDWSSCVPGAVGPCRGELAVRDLDAGTNRVLTDIRHAPGSWVDASAVSPDGTQVAYAWVDTESWEWVVQILPVGGGAAPRTVRRDSAVLWPNAWTPGGQTLLVSRKLEGEIWKIGLLSIKDGSFLEIKSLGFGNIGFSISPDGRYIAYVAPSGRGPARDIHVRAISSGEEAVVVEHPADDHSAVWSPDSNKIVFLSDRTGVPSLWAIPVRDGRPAGEPALLKPDIGDIQPLGITKAGTLYYWTANQQWNVYRASLGESGQISESPALLTDRYVNSNWGAALSPDGRRVAYYSKRPETVLIVQDLATGQEQVIPLDLEVSRMFGSGPGWMPDGSCLLVASKENGRPDTFLLKVELATGKTEEVARDLGAGFKEFPDGESVLYAGGNSTRLERLDFKTGLATVLVETSSDDHIANPAISPDGRQLAYLHQTSKGELLLLVKDLKRGSTRELLRESRVSGGSRYNTLEWTPDQNSLLYVRQDESGQSIWRIPVDGGEAVKLGVPVNAQIKAPALHSDGVTLFFTAIKADLVEVWALSNFLPEP